MNPELPVISPWRTTQGRKHRHLGAGAQTLLLRRDTEGNQLPYVDKVVLTLGENLEVINLRAIAASMTGRTPSGSAELPVFIENQQRGSTTGPPGPRRHRQRCGRCSATRATRPTPRSQVAHQVDVRRAYRWGGGIDRDQLNETFWLGLGTPGSVVCTEESPYNPAARRKLWSTYDPKNANAMPTDRAEQEDGEGYRLRTDGKGRLRLEITTYVGLMLFTQIAEMIKVQWGKLGIQADVAELERAF